MGSVRRSRRLASQEPEEVGKYNPISVRAAKQAVAFDVTTAIDRRLAGDRGFLLTLTKSQRKAVIDGLTSRCDKLEQKVVAVTTERDQVLADAGRARSLHQAAHQERIRRQIEKRRTDEASQSERETAKEPERLTLPSESPTPSRYQPQQERARVITSPVTSAPASTEVPQEQVLTITTTPASPPEPESAPAAVPVWRKLITNATGFLSPFGRRTTLPEHPAPQSGDRKRSAPEEEEEHTPKRPRTAEQPRVARAAEPTTTITQATPSRRRISVRAPQSAPAAQKEASAALGELAPAPRALLPPAQKQTPTPLGERTPVAHKRSALNADNTPMPAKTPNSFVGPSAKNSRMPTSLSTINEYSEVSRLSMLPASTPAPMSTPSRMPMKRRSVTGNRAARLSGLGSSGAGSYSWERTSTPASRPKELHADMRFAKLERMRKLERELDDLKKDDDIIEMESHRRKRVKVDNLAWIPHNRPGDSEGTFRVPDFDSDDEMEVDLSVPERSNIFEEAASLSQMEPGHVVQEVHAQQPVQAEKQEEEYVSEWNFPSVGKRTAADDISCEEEERLRVMFVEGFRAWQFETGRLVPSV
ncbi:hypothetical protein LTR08_007547 [Meristemomyces frigidus]|nr:hypothetical protein LTR08_007547 [Meristemomyces frigidus]